MTTPDRFEHDDAAYVLGILDEPERLAFEEHLRECPACVTRVEELAGTAALLADVTVSDMDGTADEPPPDTLLPSVLRRAAAERRRQRWLVGGLSAVAAALVIALAVIVWPSHQHPNVPQVRAFTAVTTTQPLHADASLVATSWGTRIDLHCRYVDGVRYTVPYRLVAVDTKGHAEDLGTWSLTADHNIEYSSGTSLAPSQISELDITLTDGRPVLQLDL